MLRSTLTALVLPLLLLLGNSSDTSSARSKPQNPETQTETVEKLIVASGTATIEIDLSRFNDGSDSTEKSNLATLHFSLAPDSFFTVVVNNSLLRTALPGSIGLIPQNGVNLPAPLGNSLQQLVLEKAQPNSAFEFAIRDARTGYVFFNIEGHHSDFDAADSSFSIKDGRLIISKEFADTLGLPAAARAAGTMSLNASMQPVEIRTIVNGEVQSAVLPPVHHRDDSGAPAAPDALVPGPDVIVGDLPSMEQGGSSGSFVGLGVGTTSCNNGDQQFHWFASPDNDHPVIPQNLYRMSGGGSNDERFEQIGQSWLKHAFAALEGNACGLGCNTSGCTTGSNLCPGCSDPYSAGLNYSQTGLGSRAWVNPFTGAYPRGDSATPPNSHAGHSHTGTSHRLMVAISDLTPATNPGATYFGEGQYVTPHEYIWCHTHAGQCNQYNNVSYRRFSTASTGSPFTFSAIGSTVRMQPAIRAWTGATINQLEPDPGNDGIGFVAYKVSGPTAGLYHYEYVVYNENLDRSIQSFSIPLDVGVTISNIGFHAPLQEPGFANDGTVGNTGFSNTAWASAQTSSSITWSSETFAQNQNANAIRWGTLYNFRFDSAFPPQNASATVGFFKTGSPMTIAIQGPVAGPTPTPAPTGTPTPTPGPTGTPTTTPTPSPTRTPTPIPTVSPIPTASPIPTPTATPIACISTLTENFDGVSAPALPSGWTATNAIGAAPLWVTSTSGNPLPAFDSAPNAAFVNDPATQSDKRLDSPPIGITSANAQISFRNNYNLESTFDGGVLEIRFGTGAFTDILAAGGSFVTGGYNATMSATNAIIGGRQAWTASSGGFITTTVNLPAAAAGQNIQLRWRMVSDTTAAAVGWRIDSIQFLCNGSATPTPPPPVCDLSEGFNDITTLVPAGWFRQNNSQPGPGTTGWFQGSTAFFPSQSGAPNSYIAADYQNGTGTSTLSNWLLTPPLTLNNGADLSFWTQTISGEFPDRLQVRMSTNGTSSNVGSTATSVGDFTTLLLDINPTYSTSGYPIVWTHFTATLTGLFGPTTGRIAFRYFVENGGPSGVNSNYVGLDTLVYAGHCGDFPTPTPPPNANISGALAYCPNPSAGPVPGVTLTLSGGASGSTLSDGSGNYSFTSLATGLGYTVTPSKATLAPGGAGITTVDVLAVQRHYLNIAALTGCRLTAADVNGDTAVNTNDVIAIQRFFIGRTFGTGNVGNYQFNPASRTYPALVSNQTGQNFDALVLGDVASSFVHRLDGSSPDAAVDVAATVAVVRLPEVIVDQSKGNFTAAVTTSVINGTNKLVGFQGDFTFDERVVTFASEPVGKAGLTSGNWNVSGNVLDGPGPIRTLRVSAYSTDFVPLSGSGTLFELKMKQLNKAAQGTQLLWASPPNNFTFIDADLNTQKPISAASGGVARR